MKKLLLIFGILISGVIFTNNVKAQDCDFYFPFEKGTIVETTNYDKKNKETSKTYQKVLDYSKSNGVTEVKIENKIEAKDADSVITQEFSVRCENGEFYINMDSYLNQETMSAYQAMQIEVDADNMTIPANVSKGQSLNDGRVSATILNSGIKVLTITVVIKNRKVDGFEKVTTPAGTFDCVKISYDMEMKMLFKIKASATQWFAKGVGVVKSENYNKKGKLESTSMITKITK
ncbi:MAG: hypothetical protein B6I20_04080 [Bacteroidetes bacterium 4572_117]|nr:MAG: hypothetical protein B6I20_04080 [Bacteroidetes bacterium 4572_117]